MKLCPIMLASVSAVLAFSAVIPGSPRPTAEQFMDGGKCMKESCEWWVEATPEVPGHCAVKEK